MKRIVLLFLLGMPAFLSGCRAGSEKEYVLLTGNSGSCEKEIAEGFLEQMETYGVKASVEVPENFTISSQYESFEKLIKKDVAGIAVLPNSMRSLKDLAEEGKEKNLTIVSVENAIISEHTDFNVFSMENEETARELLAKAAEKMDGKGQIAILASTNQVTSTEKMIATIRNELESGYYPDILLTEISYVNNDTEKYRSKTEHLLETYPDLNMILTLTADATADAAEVIQEKHSDVQIAGLCSLGENIPDSVAYSYSYDTRLLGRLSAAVLLKISREGMSCPEGDILEFEGLGCWVVENYDGVYDLIGDNHQVCIYMNRRQ